MGKDLGSRVHTSLLVNELLHFPLKAIECLTLNRGVLNGDKCIRRGVKKDKLTSRVNSSRAHRAWLIRGHEKESFRQKLKEAWNKRNKV